MEQEVERAEGSGWSLRRGFAVTTRQISFLFCLNTKKKARVMGVRSFTSVQAMMSRDVLMPHERH